MSRSRSFTLIELLVVISIIALLASVVLASLNSARDKGRLGAAKYFASQVDHAAGDQAVGIWDFDECSGTTASDRSGNGNSGAITSGVSWSTDTPSGQGCSALFDGTAALSYAGGSTNVPAFQLGTSDFTIAGWINPAVVVLGGSHQSIFSSQGGGVRVALGISPPTVVDFQLISGATSLGGSGTSQVPLNKWSFLTLVVDRVSNKATAYLNGSPTNISNYDISALGSLSLSFAGPTISGGTWGGIGSFLNGKIDAVRIYTKTLSAFEVGKLYTSEGSRFNVASK